VKYKLNGSLEHYKANLVAKEFTETYGVDYEDTFAIVAKMNIVIIILSLTTYFGWELQKIDMKNALWHGQLEE